IECHGCSTRGISKARPLGSTGTYELRPARKFRNHLRQASLASVRQGLVQCASSKPLAMAYRTDVQVQSQLLRSSRVSSSKSRVIISGATLGLGGIRTHLVLLCRLLRQKGIEVCVFATGSHWDQGAIASLATQGVRFFLPPPMLRNLRIFGGCYSA